MCRAEGQEYGEPQQQQQQQQEQEQPTVFGMGAALQGNRLESLGGMGPLRGGVMAMEGQWR
jgi:hypothetical protein